MSKKREEEKPDELGFTISDYCDMQKLAEQEGKLNDTLLSDWDITPEQITLINSPFHPFHAVAVTAFYDVNYKRLKRMARAFLAPLSCFHNLISVISYEDLLQQVFADMLGGFLKLPHDTEKIKNAIYKCFRYAAVGGLEGLDDVKDKRALYLTA